MMPFAIVMLLSPEPTSINFGNTGGREDETEVLKSSRIPECVSTKLFRA